MNAIKELELKEIFQSMEIVNEIPPSHWAPSPPSLKNR